MDALQGSSEQHKASDAFTPPSGAFKPPKLTNKQALDLRKQAVLGHASTTATTHHLDAVQEDAMDSSVQECSRLSLDSSSSGSSHSAGLRHRITLGSWEEYWDTRQAVEIPGR